MSTKIFIIGSNSFSGAGFARYALQQGCHVIGASRSPEPDSVFLPYRWQPDALVQFEFHQLDINKDLDALNDLMRREKPGVVVNFAAQSMVGQSWSTPEHWFQTNVVSTVKLHDRLRHFDFLDKYVHVTTPEVYGSTEDFIDENTSFNPSTPYAVSRAAADMSLRSFHEAYGFPVVFTRAANVYGPGQQLYRIIPRAILFAALGRKLQLHGGGLSERSFVHIDDVSDATWRVMKDGRLGEVYHISTNDILSIRDLVQKICDIMGVAFSSVAEVVDERLGKDTAYKLDSTKIRSSLGWCDSISITDGLEKCVSWVMENIDILKSQPFDYQHKA